MDTTILDAACEAEHVGDGTAGDNDMTDTQETLPQTQELTQMADESLLSPGGAMSNSNISSAASAPDLVNPRTIPWARLIPCSRHGPEALNTGASVEVECPLARSNGAGGIDLFPRDPMQKQKSSSSRSPSSSSGGAVNATFLGLEGLRPSDVFNEFVLGRSLKSDLVAKPQPTTKAQFRYGHGHASQSEENDTKDKNNEWVHSTISNKHCKIYCLLKAPALTEMEVYVDDCSGNGTTVNSTTLLRRGERRLLHTGDEVCLVNPKILCKKFSSGEEQADIVRHYSYIFVNTYNLHQQHQQQVQQLQYQHRRETNSTVGNGSVRRNAKRAGLVDVTKVKPSQEVEGGRDADLDRAAMIAMPPPTSKLFSAVMRGQAGNFATGSGRVRESGHSGTSNCMDQKQHPPAQSRPAKRGRQRRFEEQFEIRELLGTGTCGEVRRCINRRSGVEHAVKIIPLSNRGRMSAMRLQMTDTAIQAEAKILQMIDHPYIVDLVDVFVVPNQAVYLVMELLHGGDLFDRIVEKGRYSETEARQAMRRILSAVHYLHQSKQICHRDLKPENILMVGKADDISIKLTDFGLAKSVTDEGLKTFCGTPQYFAPEVLRRRHTVAGRGRYGFEADMWSLGIILYILLSGVPPFDVSDSIDVVAEAEISFEDHQWRGVSDLAKNFVRRLLVADPTKRLTVEDACEHDWLLQEDGDTHCHPLADPAFPSESSREHASKIWREEERSAAASGGNPEARPSPRSTAVGKGTMNTKSISKSGSRVTECYQSKSKLVQPTLDGKIVDPTTPDYRNNDTASDTSSEGKRKRVNDSDELARSSLVVSSNKVQRTLDGKVAANQQIEAVGEVNDDSASASASGQPSNIQESQESESTSVKNTGTDIGSKSQPTLARWFVGKSK